MAGSSSKGKENFWLTLWFLYVCIWISIAIFSGYYIMNKQQVTKETYIPQWALVDRDKLPREIYDKFKSTIDPSGNPENIIFSDNIENKEKINNNGEKINNNDEKLDNNEEKLDNNGENQEIANNNEINPDIIKAIESFGNLK